MSNLVNNLYQQQQYQQVLQQQQLNNQANPQQINQYLIKSMTNSVLSIIQVLGFDILSNEKEHRIQLNTNTFVKPNSKAFEVILHFLLCQLDPERAQRSFIQCWPQILKEQQREFKEVTYAWLVELTSALKPQQQQQQPASTKLASNLVLQYQHILQFIKFPIINKSLFLTHGIKICELLFALSQYVLLIRVIKLIENDKINSNNPRIIPFIDRCLYLSSLVVDTQTTQKMSSKELIQFELLIRNLKLRINHNLTNIFQLVNKLINLKTKWQQYSIEKTSNIRQLVDKNAQIKSSFKKKSLILDKLLNTNNETTSQSQIALNNLDAQLKQVNENKFKYFEIKWNKFKSFIDESIQNDKNKESINYLLNGDTNSLELNGLDFINNLKLESKEDSLHLDDNSVKLVFENIDQIAAIRNAEIGKLFHDDFTKIDLISLARLYNLVLILKGDLLNKVDRIKLNELASNLNNSDSDVSSNFSLFQSSKVLNKQINEDAQKLKKNLEFYVKKMSQNCNEAVKEALEKFNIKESDGTIYEQSKTDITQNTFKFLDEYFNMSKRSIIDKNLLLELEEKYKNNESFNDFINNNSSVKVNIANNLSETNKSANLIISESNENDLNNLRKSSSASISDKQNHILLNGDFDQQNHNISPIACSDSETMMDLENSKMKTNNQSNSNESPSFDIESSNSLQILDLDEGDDDLL